MAGGCSPVRVLPLTCLRLLRASRRIRSTVRACGAHALWGTVLVGRSLLRRMVLSRICVGVTGASSRFLGGCGLAPCRRLTWPACPPGERYIPGPAVAKALSDQCAPKVSGGHQNQAGLNGARSSNSAEVVHSAAPSAAVNSVVDKPTSPSRDKVVGPVGSGVKDNYDREILAVAAVVTLVGLALAVWVERRGARRRMGRLGSR